MNKIIYSFVFLIFSYVFLKHALHMFQQNRYELKRYSSWLFSLKPFLLELKITYIALMVILIFLKRYYAYIACFVISLLFGIILIVAESNKTYVKPLVYTSRVKRTLVVFVLTTLVSLYLLVNIFETKISIVGIIACFLPYILMYIVVIILMPFEYFIKKHYENEARNILNKHDSLIKIGITGSYGKTTTKNIVGEILNSSMYTLITPASYNTPMGITRTIRENLKNTHEAFVIEMGADKVGDITYLMNMTRPKYGIVSSIGPQHLNTFYSLDNIIREKMREIEMLPEDGVGIINVDNEYIANYEIKNICKIITVGLHNQEAMYRAKDVEYTKEGTRFKVVHEDEEYELKTSLIGEHNVLNILLAFALADELKIDKDRIIQAIANLSQVEHRLELKKINGYSFIDDAFNSNPSGCIYALKALKMMNGRRVVVTPGLIDLGEKQNRANYDFGRFMLDTTDFVILVGKNQTKYILKGLNDVGYNKDSIVIVDSIYEAFNYVYTNFTLEDTILLENDLPDVYRS